MDQSFGSGVLLVFLRLELKALFFGVKLRDRLVAGILFIGVVLEAVASVHNRVLKPAADWESVTHYSPLQNTHTHTSGALYLQTDHSDTSV